MAMWLLWIFSLAASFLLPATGEVVHSFNKCNQFFLDGNAPSLAPNNSARICQLYSNQYRFATMYDRAGRIPLYSAYRYKPSRGERPEEWLIEPQLALPKDHRRKSMELEKSSKIDREKLKKSQAVEDDYKSGILYDKGHMAPPSHQPDGDSKLATFTLTNIVPQLRVLNSGEWRKYEEGINAARCQQTYVIVGAVPGNESINNRVNVPSHIWAAGCCVNANNHRRPWAVIAKNDKNKVDKLTLSKLQEQLASLYGQDKIDLFNRRCRKLKTELTKQSKNLAA